LRRSSSRGCGRCPIPSPPRSARVRDERRRACPSVASSVRHADVDSRRVRPLTALATHAISAWTFATANNGSRGRQLRSLQQCTPGRAPLPGEMRLAS
jgi:hypothetical protein